MAHVSEMPKKKKFSAVKDAQDKIYLAEDAARTMKRLAEIKREIREIKADPPPFKAARAILRQEIGDIKSGLKT